MLRKLALLIAGAGIVALLLLGQRFHRARVPDRELLIEALHVGGIDDRHINWDVFYQQAAQGYYDDAKATILLSPYDHDLQSALIALAKVRARNGDAQGAVKTARGYSPATREEAFHQIAVAQAKSGDVPGARQTASLLVTPQPALENIAAVQAENGDLRGARETIASLSQPNLALAAIGEYQVKSGDFEGALKTAESMDTKAVVNLLLDIGLELTRRGEQKRVRELASHITNREVAKLFVDYAHLAQSTVDHLEIVEANVCERASFEAMKGHFSSAYRMISNTKCWYSFIAVKQYGADPAGAEHSLRRSTEPADVCFGLAQFSEAAAAKGNVPEALRLLNAAQNACGQQNENRVWAVLSEVARQCTVKRGPRVMVKWARARPTAAERYLALLGVAAALGHAHPSYW